MTHTCPIQTGIGCDAACKDLTICGDNRLSRQMDGDKVAMPSPRDTRLHCSWLAQPRVIAVKINFAIQHLFAADTGGIHETDLDVFSGKTLCIRQIGIGEHL